MQQAIPKAGADGEPVIAPVRLDEHIGVQQKYGRRRAVHQAAAQSMNLSKVLPLSPVSE